MSMTARQLACLEKALIAALTVNPGIKIQPADLQTLCDCFKKALEDVVVDVTGTVSLDPATIADIKAALDAALAAATVKVKLDPADIAAIGAAFTVALEAVVVDVKLDPASVTALCDCFKKALEDVVVDVKLDPTSIADIKQVLEDVVVDVRFDATSTPFKVEIINPSKDAEKVVLCDPNTRLPILVVTVFDPVTGLPQAPTAYNINGSPYLSPIGALVDCATNTKQVESDPVEYCDGTGKSFLRWFNTLDGVMQGSFDTDLAGAPYAPVAPVKAGSCVAATSGDMVVISDVVEACVENPAGTFKNYAVRVVEIRKAADGSVVSSVTQFSSDGQVWSTTVPTGTLTLGECVPVEPPVVPTAVIQVVRGDPICVKLADGSFQEAIPYSTYNGTAFTAGGLLDPNTMLPLAGATATDACDCPCITCP
jgi:hypothetical protein